MADLCERCSYDEVDPEATVADIFQDRYLALCAACAKALHLKQAKMEDWA